MASVVRTNFIAPGTQIAATATAYVTAAAGETLLIDKILVFNTNSTTETVKAYINTTTPGASHQVLESSVTNGTHSDITAGANITLNGGQILYLLTTTASKVNLHIGGRKVVG